MRTNKKWSRHIYEHLPLICVYTYFMCSLSLTYMVDEVVVSSQPASQQYHIYTHPNYTQSITYYNFSNCFFFLLFLWCSRSRAISHALQMAFFRTRTAATSSSSEEVSAAAAATTATNDSKRLTLLCTNMFMTTVSHILTYTGTIVGLVVAGSDSDSDSGALALVIWKNRFPFLFCISFCFVLHFVSSRFGIWNIAIHVYVWF